MLPSAILAQEGTVWRSVPTNNYPAKGGFFCFSFAYNHFIAVLNHVQSFLLAEFNVDSILVMHFTFRSINEAEQLYNGRISCFA